MALDAFSILSSIVFGLIVGYAGLKLLQIFVIGSGNRNQFQGGFAVYTHADRVEDIRFTGRMGFCTGTIVLAAIIFGALMAHFSSAHVFFAGPFLTAIGIICGAVTCFLQECWYRIKSMWRI